MKKLIAALAAAGLLAGCSSSGSPSVSRTTVTATATVQAPSAVSDPSTDSAQSWKQRAQNHIAALVADFAEMDADIQALNGPGTRTACLRLITDAHTMQTDLPSPDDQVTAALQFAIDKDLGEGLACEQYDSDAEANGESGAEYATQQAAAQIQRLS